MTSSRGIAILVGLLMAVMAPVVAAQVTVSVDGNTVSADIAHQSAPTPGPNLQTGHIPG